MVSTYPSWKAMMITLKSDLITSSLQIQKFLVFGIFSIIQIFPVYTPVKWNILDWFLRYSSRLAGWTALIPMVSWLKMLNQDTSLNHNSFFISWQYYNLFSTIIQEKYTQHILMFIATVDCKGIEQHWKTRRLFGFLKNYK